MKTRDWYKEPLLKAMDAKRLEAVKRELAAGADPNVRGYVGGRKWYQPLHFLKKWLLAPEAVEVSTLLLDAGADINATINDRQELTPLELLASALVAEGLNASTLRLFDLLLSRGAGRLDHVDRDGWTVLVSAIHAGIRQPFPDDLPQLVRMLVDAGASLELRSKEFGTPLYHAADTSSRLVEVLLECGAVAAGAQGPQDNTPLHAAAFAGDIATIELLLEAGAKKDARSRNRHFPLPVDAAQTDELKKLLAP
jgi:ankyrin repeat protein